MTAGAVNAFRVEVIRTEKATDDWPFFTVEFVIFATDAEWAVKIAEDAIGLMELQRGAYNSMRIDNACEITVSRM